MAKKPLVIFSVALVVLLAIGAWRLKGMEPELFGMPAGFKQIGPRQDLPYKAGQRSFWVYNAQMSFADAKAALEKKMKATDIEDVGGEIQGDGTVEFQGHSWVGKPGSEMEGFSISLVSDSDLPWRVDDKGAPLNPRAKKGWVSAVLCMDYKEQSVLQRLIMRAKELLPK